MQYTCINRKVLKIRTICNYALHDLCFSLHVDESNNMIKMLSQKHNNYNKVIVKLVSKKDINTPPSPILLHRFL